MNELAPHTQLRDGRYEVLEQIGKGTFGTVYHAHDSLKDKPVALKQLSANTPEQIKSFEREAKLLAKLKHSNLPEVSDHFTEQGTWFLVMDFIPGETLFARLERHNGPLPPTEVLEWADQILATLEYLHSIQPDPVIHRDIKPENLKLTPDGRVMLLDFGIAKSTLPTGGSIPSQRFGTRHYAPPEQVRGTGTDSRSDLYALAATLYHLLTDTLPNDVYDRLSCGSQADPLVPPQQLVPTLSPVLGAVLLQALNLAAEQRHGSASAMRQALKVVAAQVNPAAPVPHPPNPPAPPPPLPIAVPTEVLPAPTPGPVVRRSPVAAIVLMGVVALLGLGLIGMGVASWNSPKDSQTSSTASTPSVSMPTVPIIVSPSSTVPLVTSTVPPATSTVPPIESTQPAVALPVLPDAPTEPPIPPTLPPGLVFNTVITSQPTMPSVGSTITPLPPTVPPSMTPVMPSVTPVSPVPPSPTVTPSTAVLRPTTVPRPPTVPPVRPTAVPPVRPTAVPPVRPTATPIVNSAPTKPSGPDD